MSKEVSGMFEEGKSVLMSEQDKLSVSGTTGGGVIFTETWGSGLLLELPGFA